MNLAQALKAAISNRFPLANLAYRGVKKAVERVPAAQSFSEFSKGKTLGATGRLIDVVGKALGNPLPEKHISERLETMGSKLVSNAMAAEPASQWRIKKVLSQGKQPSPADTGAVQKYQQQQQQQQQQPPSVNWTQPVDTGAYSSREFGREELAQALGVPVSNIWNKATVTKDGVVYQIEDTGRATFRAHPVASVGSTNQAPEQAPPPPPPVSSPEEVKSKANELGVGHLLDNSDIEDIYNKVRASGEDLASAIQSRAEQLAEKYGQMIQEEAARQRGEVETKAKESRGLLEKERELTAQKLKLAKEEELKQIEKGKLTSEEALREERERISRLWRETSLRLQRQFRALGVSDSSFAVGEENKLHRDINSGLKKLALKHMGAVKEFADAMQKVVNAYNIKEQEADLEYKRRLKEIDDWTRDEMTRIRQLENLGVREKLLMMKDALDKADSIRSQIEQNILSTQLKRALMMDELRTKMAYAIKTAASSNKAKATSLVNDALKVSRLIQAALNDPAATFVKDGDQWYIQSSLFLPFGTDKYPVSDEVAKKRRLDNLKPLLSAINTIEPKGLAGEINPTPETAALRSYVSQEIADIYGIPKQPLQQTQEQTQSQGGGLFSAIKGIFGGNK